MDRYGRLVPKSAHGSINLEGYTSSTRRITRAVMELYDRVEPELKPYVRDPRKYVAAPANAVVRHAEVEKRMDALRQFAETTPLNRVEMELNKRNEVRKT